MRFRQQKIFWWRIPLNIDLSGSLTLIVHTRLHWKHAPDNAKDNPHLVFGDDDEGQDCGDDGRDEGDNYDGHHDDVYPTNTLSAKSGKC